MRTIRRDPLPPPRRSYNFTTADASGKGPKEKGAIWCSEPEWHRRRWVGRHRREEWHTQQHTPSPADRLFVPMRFAWLSYSSPADRLCPRGGWPGGLSVICPVSLADVSEGSGEPYTHRRDHSFCPGTGTHTTGTLCRTGRSSAHVSYRKGGIARWI